MDDLTNRDLRGTPTQAIRTQSHEPYIFPTVRIYQGPQIMATDVTTELVFLRKEAKHDTEKPYKLQYDPGQGLPRSNCINEATEDITIHDIRGRESQFSLKTEGFEYRRMKTSLSPEDFYDESRVKKVYYRELQDLLMGLLGAKRVEVLEHGVIILRYDLEDCR